MRQIGNPLFSNPVKANRLRISVRPMLIGLHVVQRQVGAFPLFDNQITLVWQGAGCPENWDWALNSRQTPARNVF
jgi:hypothetical protein